MSTRSRIGIRNKDNTITSIYCHWDGYPTWNGKMLLTYYTKREDVEKLIKLGNLSTLGRTPTAPDLNDVDIAMFSYKRDVYEKIRKENEVKGTMGNPCCIPHSIREDYAKPEDHEAITHGNGDFPDCWQEYEYLFTKQGKWQYRKVGRKKFRPLTQEIVTKK